MPTGSENMGVGGVTLRAAVSAEWKNQEPELVGPEQFSWKVWQEKKQRNGKQKRGYEWKEESECLISLRIEDIKECCMLLELKGVQRKRHSGERENLPEQGSWYLSPKTIGGVGLCDN